MLKNNITDQELDTILRSEIISQRTKSDEDIIEFVKSLSISKNFCYNEHEIDLRVSVIRIEASSYH